MCERTLSRQALRAAIRIHEHLRCSASRASVAALPISRWNELATIFQRFRYTQERGWQAAGASVVSDLDYQFRRLAAELESARSMLPQRQAGPVSSAGTIAADLLTMPDEFEAVSIDLKEKVLRVDTARIILEDLDLGPFQIVLHWERIGAGRAYEVRALEPNCPSGRDDVTHPHVEDHQLCEGAGAPAIRTALISGRLLDLFVLVRQILETYNGGSAYVSISDWSGSDDVTCADCGCFTSSGDAVTCERCETRICSDCESSCGGCGRYVCSDCCGVCADCSNSFCQTCLNEVAETQRLLCDSCLEKKEESEDVEDDKQATEADTLCVGEAAAPARPGQH